MKYETKKRFAALPVIAFAALVLILTGCNPSSGSGGGGGEICETGSVLPCASAGAQTIYLRAEPFLQTMNDGAIVTMWGYAIDSSAGAGDGALSSPGPDIVIHSCTQNLIVQLNNNLPVATSLVVNGLNRPMAPTYHPDGRVRSLDEEVPPGGSATYTWTNIAPGTYLYQSGTQMQVQVQMGLVGSTRKNYNNGVAYPEKNFCRQFMIVYSEVDPDLHQAVATGNYGPAGTMTSTIDYRPKYFLVNGIPYSSGDSVKLNNPKVMNTLFRLVNAGLKSRTMMFLNGRVQVLAEDGRPYTYEHDGYSVPLEAGKTKDVVIRNEKQIVFALDRSLGF